MLFKPHFNYIDHGKYYIKKINEHFKSKLMKNDVIEMKLKNNNLTKQNVNHL